MYLSIQRGVEKSIHLLFLYYSFTIPLLFLYWLAMAGGRLARLAVGWRSAGGRLAVGWRLAGGWLAVASR